MVGSILNKHWIPIMLTVASVTLSVIVYTYIVSYWSPEHNVFSLLDRRPTPYIIFSGTDGGFYVRIGRALEAHTSEGHRIRLTNSETAGGSENAIKVVATGYAFGLLQEETLHSDDPLRAQMKYITPLYLERMHIVCGKRFYKCLSDILTTGTKLSTGSAAEDKSRHRVHLRGSLKDDKSFKSHCATARICVGPVGSGTRVLASYLLESLGVSYIEEPATNIRDALAKIRTNEADVVFVHAGAPLDRVRKLLENDKASLVGVDPSMVALLNEKYRLHLRMTNFKKIYDGENAVASFGSYAYLIASKDVPSSDVAAVVTALHETKTRIRNDMDIESGGHFQLDEFDFQGLVARHDEQRTIQTLAALLGFVAAVAVGSTAALMFLRQVVSFFVRSWFSGRIGELVSNIPESMWELDQIEADQLKSVSTKGRRDMVLNVTEQMRKVNRLERRVSDASRMGVLTNSHRRALLDVVDRSGRGLRGELCGQILDGIEGGEIANDQVFRELLIGGYLSIGEYGQLREAFLSRRRRRPRRQN